MKHIPAPIPAAEIPADGKTPFVHRHDAGISPLCGIPDFGRFYGSRGQYMGVAALAKNLPHRSREHEFTDGRVYGVKDRYVLYGFGRVQRVAREQ